MSSAFRLLSHNGSIYISMDDSETFLSPTGDFSPDILFSQEDPYGYLKSVSANAGSVSFDQSEVQQLQPFIESQEVWAAGVTYYRSRSARMEEAESSGGDVFYDRVYEAERPELFFKSPAGKVRGSGEPVCIRADSTWDVPEPELTLAINSAGKVFGYTIGNDMSSRSIEGENPLYLPQAKSYTGSCALGPCLLVPEKPLEKSTSIHIEISRHGEVVFAESTDIGQIKRGFDELAGFLFRANDFSRGAYLMTGTGIVPDAPLTLAVDDVVAITIDGIGTLRNSVEKVGTP